MEAFPPGLPSGSGPGYAVPMPVLAAGIWSLFPLKPGWSREKTRTAGRFDPLTRCGDLVSVTRLPRQGLLITIKS
jgi:hypothetical protein